jgi:hypothetical protein
MSDGEPEEEFNIDSMIDIEIELTKRFPWSLKDIDDTDIESLFPFIFRISGTTSARKVKKFYCDEVAWL